MPAAGDVEENSWDRQTAPSSPSVLAVDLDGPEQSQVRPGALQREFDLTWNQRGRRSTAVSSSSPIRPGRPRSHEGPAGSTNVPAIADGDLHAAGDGVATSEQVGAEHGCGVGSLWQVACKIN
jgi:hypothetical protein